MLSMVLLICAIGLTSAVLTRWLSHPDAPIRILDRPNERSLHAAPTPRTGGIAICVALLIGWIVSSAIAKTPWLPAGIVPGALVIAAVALIDDRYDLSAALRLVIQFGAALLLCYDGFVIDGEVLPGVGLSAAPAVVLGVTVLLTLWLTNLYNFMDGMDGFAAGMAVIGFVTLALFGWEQGAMLFAGASCAVAAAAAGFLWFNFPPARIFMGDSGSTTLGFLVAGFGIWGSRLDVLPIWLTLTIFSPFVLDASVTLVRRAIRGERVWRAHRSHYYQRLVRLGWGHRRVVLGEYAVMLACAISAWVMLGKDTDTQWGMLTGLVGGYFLAAVAIHRLERTHHAKLEN